MEVNEMNVRIYGHSNPLDGLDVMKVTPGDEDVPDVAAEVTRPRVYDEPALKAQTSDNERRYRAMHQAPVLAKAADPAVHVEPHSAHGPFAKGSVGASLGVIRTEEKKIGDDRWVYGYNAAGELIDAYLCE